MGLFSETAVTIQGAVGVSGWVWVGRRVGVVPSLRLGFMKELFRRTEGVALSYVIALRGSLSPVPLLAKVGAGLSVYGWFM